MPPKSKSEGNFKKGEKVKAKWSGSNVFYEAKILEVNPRTCKVEFDDGSIFNVKHADIKSPSKSDKTEKDVKKEISPKRTRSRSRSTGRTRSRSRSPARTEKKSSSKSEKKVSKVEKFKSEVSPKTNSTGKDETDTIVKSSLVREKIGSVKEEIKASVSSITTSNSYSSKNLYVALDKKEPIELRLRSTRLSALRSSDTSPTEIKTYEKSNAIPKRDETKYSDDEESEEEDEIKIIPKKPSKLVQTFSFLFTLLRIILMPTSLLFLVFACTKKQCTILEMPQFYSKWKDVGNAIKFPLPSVALFHVAICLMSLIPVGKKSVGFPYGLRKTTKEYCINGFICLITSIIVFSVCSYFGIYMNWGYDKFKALTLSIIIYCIICSLIMHIGSLIKGEGSKESKVPLLGNFFHGIHYNPFLFGKVDVKTSFIRAGLIGSVLINLSILLKYFLMKGYLTVRIGLAFGMQAFFIIDYFIREEKMLSTATYTMDSVGYGFIMTTGFLIPIGLSSIVVFLFIFDPMKPLMIWCAAAIVAIFLFGYYIYMSSGNLKHNFRRNPFSPSLSDVESIPTSQKKRLISSKLWGIVRHPNYVGLILMVVAWTLPCGFSHLSPFGPLAMVIIALVVRSFRIEAECKEKYGPAWNNYCEKVKSRFIRYIF